MTVVAAYRGRNQTQNALIADTICSARDKPSECAFWNDKISLVFGNTYASAVGDADVLTDLAPFEEGLRTNTFETLVTIVGSVNNIARSDGKKGLSYDLDGRFSGVVLPHKTSRPVNRIHPFPLPELMVRECGPEFLPLLEEQEFTSFSLPKAE